MKGLAENESEIWERRARVLADLRAMRKEQPSVYEGNLIGEARQEREDEMDEMWRGLLPGNVSGAHPQTI